MSVTFNRRRIYLDFFCQQDVVDGTNDNPAVVSYTSLHVVTAFYAKLLFLQLSPLLFS